MSEVKRYLIQKTPIGTMMKPNLEGNWVAFEDFDRVTAERDAALGREAALQRCISTLELIINSGANQRDALQQRLTAADERADVLESALRELLAGTGNSPGANRKYGRARAVLAGSQKQASPEPYQGIPGTSFQRLNALANQGE